MTYKKCETYLPYVRLVTLCKANTGTAFCNTNILHMIFFVDLKLHARFETITVVLLKTQVFLRRDAVYSGD